MRWMEPKNPKPNERQLARVWAQLKAGVPRETIARCCTTCREALKRWPVITGASAPRPSESK